MKCVIFRAAEVRGGRNELRRRTRPEGPELLKNTKIHETETRKNARQKVNNHRGAVTGSERSSAHSAS